MAVDIDARLRRLRSRRTGIDRLVYLNDAEQRSVIANSLQEESWQKRALTQPYTRYALGAMQEVGADYTRISLHTAERVGNQIKLGLDARGIPVEFRLQGSVPLNVHIRGVSDVDLLTLDKNFLTYASYGSRNHLYTGATTRTSLEVLLNLRKETESILIAKFPAAKVDTSGGKAIAISGGSLARPVDVVPSHWYDSGAYQNSQDEKDRGVTILNKKVPETIDNYPFLHIDRINERDKSALGGLKKAIRLCKNVKNDAIEDGRVINLPSFDIAGLMWHAGLDALIIGYVYELSILAEAQRFLDHLYHNKDTAHSLKTPDGTRSIINSEAKFQGLQQLSIELDDLVREVAKEQNTRLFLESNVLLNDARSAISSLKLPA